MEKTEPVEGAEYIPSAALFEAVFAPSDEVEVDYTDDTFAKLLFSGDSLEKVQKLTGVDDAETFLKLFRKGQELGLGVMKKLFLILAPSPSPRPMTMKTSRSSSARRAR